MTRHCEEVLIPSTPGAEKLARSKAMEFGKLAGFADARVDDIQTAVNEATLNALEHATPGGASGTVHVGFFLDTAELRITVQNKGVQFVPSDVKPDIRKKIEGSDRPRGWGLYLIRRLADEFTVEYDKGTTTVTMRFRR